MGGADLLLALDDQLQVHGRPLAALEPGAQGAGEDDDAGLVVDDAAPVEPPGLALSIDTRRLEGRASPMALAARGLDVVVGVEEQRRGARTGAEPLAEGRRDARRRGVRSSTRSKPEAASSCATASALRRTWAAGNPSADTLGIRARARSARRCGLRGSARARRARRRCPAISRAALHLPIGSHPAWSRSIVSPPRPSALVPPRGVRRASVPSGAETGESYPQVERNAGAARGDEGGAPQSVARLDTRRRLRHAWSVHDRSERLQTRTSTVRRLENGHGKRIEAREVLRIGRRVRSTLQGPDKGSK
jgi:hypothetical protein